jgi:hypothetical protein
MDKEKERGRREREGKVERGRKREGEEERGEGRESPSVWGKTDRDIACVSEYV